MPGPPRGREAAWGGGAAGGAAAASFSSSSPPPRAGSGGAAAPPAPRVPPRPGSGPAASRPPFPLSLSGRGGRARPLARSRRVGSPSSRPRPPHAGPGGPGQPRGLLAACPPRGSARPGPPRPTAPARPRAHSTHLNLLSMVTSRAPAAAPAPPGTSAPPGRGEGAAPAAERWAAGAAQRRGGRRPMAAPLRSPGSGRDCGGARHRLLPRLSVPVAAAPAPSGNQEAPRRPGEPLGLVSPEGGGGGRQPCPPRQVRAEPARAPAGGPGQRVGTVRCPLTGTCTRCSDRSRDGSGSCVH